MLIQFAQSSFFFMVGNTSSDDRTNNNISLHEEITSIGYRKKIL